MQERILIFFQEISSPLLDRAAEGITMLGEQYFYIAVIAFIFWNVSRRAGLIISMAYLFSALTNSALKLSFRTERPFEVLSFIEGKRVHTATGYSFPSGHTQGAAGFLTAAALQAGKRWFSICAALLMVLVAISRVYLGVHWPVDVVFGLLFGVLVAWGTVSLLRAAGDREELLRRIIFIITAATAAAALLLLFLDGSGLLGELKINDFFKIAGTTTGALGGFLLEERLVRFSTGGSAVKKAVRFIAGLATTIALLSGLKALFPGHNGFDALRYLLTGMWLTFFFPWIGTRTALFAREDA